ncbi:pyrroline-5-carboxylate reductase [Pelagibius litoralis]|uniref:Pyrroline-5-carboxylate reductase n=1 Tax=Pelagibius litoralis TaxID=374515 RepID=A0A967KDB5_9PROT|nr:pyrroline-5-carboxylate reductase [Pelagibius litoralis]NIA71324.1 pyrroline-5-carboxylate reductase [Pelagibius litoralis]
MRDPRVTRVVLIGAGRMGHAMLVGWLRELRPSHEFHVVDPGVCDAVAALRKRLANPGSLVHYASAQDLPDDLAADVIVLATKPRIIAAALQAMPKPTALNAVVISVAAGVGIADIQQHLHGNLSTVRVMPNIGASVGYSVSAGFADASTKPDGRVHVELLFQAIGTFSWLESEDQLHAVTALSGSGPAYVFAMCEAMIMAGIEQGLDDTTARSLAIATVSAAGRLLENCPDPGLLRETVTSPNGTTAAGLAVLGKENVLERLVWQTLDAARQRSISLSNF